MKKYIFAGITLFFIGCSSSINIIRDDFDDSVKIDRSILFFATPMSMGVNNITFKKVFKNNVSSPTKLYMRITTSPEYGALGENVSLKLDNKIYQLKFSTVSGQIETTLSKDFSTGKMETDSDKIYNAELSLTGDLEKLILASEKCMIRITLGPKEATFTIDGSDLLKVKEFITYNPNGK